GDGSKNRPRAFKSAVSAYETLVEDLPERVSPVVGDNQGMSLFLDRNVQVPGSDKLALLVFTQKSYPPAFLKNVALATEGVVEVGMITHPRDDLLESFQIRSLPNIVIVYDTPQDQRPEGAGEEGGVLLGQAVYDTGTFGTFGFEGVMRKLPSAASISSSSKYWAAVHATCNPQVAESFNVDLSLLPAVVAYSPKAGRFATYIGSGTEPKEIAVWVDRVARGKVQTEKIEGGVDKGEYVDECVMEEVEEDGMDVDEMLREMREEEEEERRRLEEEEREEEERERKRKEEEEEEEEESKKKKKKKKKRKKKKKKKKKKEEEEETEEGEGGDEDHIEL
ncbi:hypothetical protein TrRE_jg9472, partial [Triparma retinervis]